MLVQLYVGQTKNLSDAEGEYQSSIQRDPVEGPVLVTAEGLVGDRVTNARHGGKYAAVCVYLSETYRDWAEKDGIQLRPGAFGENFTVSSLREEDLCAGDIVRVGKALFQITGQRGPCAVLARHVGIPDFHKLAVQRSRTGCYLSVLEEGEVQRGDHWTLVERWNPAATIPAMNACFYVAFDPQFAQEIIAMKGINPDWQRRAKEKLDAIRAGRGGA